MTITEFLEARIAEDRADAMSAASASGLEWIAQGSLLMYIADPASRYAEVLAGVETYRQDAALSHADRFDPARVLAECEAKRRIVEMWATRDDDHPVTTAHRTGLGLALRALAAVYADHPDYNPAWAA